MDRPKRNSVLHPANYGAAWWHGVELEESLSPTAQEEGSEHGPENRRVDESSSGEGDSQWSSNISSETDLEIDVSLAESRSDTDGSISDSEASLNNFGQARTVKGKSKGTRKRTNQSGDQNEEEYPKSRKKITQQSEKGKMRDMGESMIDAKEPTENMVASGSVVAEGKKAGRRSATQLV